MKAPRAPPSTPVGFSFVCPATRVPYLSACRSSGLAEVADRDLERARHLQRGGTPNDREIRLALALDADGLGHRLSDHDLALAMCASKALERLAPGYKTAVRAADEARYGPSAVDELTERVIAGEGLPPRALEDAQNADRRRRSATYARALSTARRAICDAARPRLAQPRARPRARAPRAGARRTAASRDGPSGDDGPSAEGDGEAPPPGLLHALELLETALQSVRWCRACGCFAFAIDAYQRDQLDAVGFTTICPDCRGGVRSYPR